ncbi:GNAT family N-acetyltransferase [candidate division KSB1 bacterium]|nr:GNAT family N-acetyltransferase [candidate division KSB1 bacterium]
MQLEVKPVELAEIGALRDLYRQEMNCQIVHDSWPRRGLVAPHLLCVDGKVAGYGTVTIGEVIEPGTVNEFYLLPSYRTHAIPLFRELLANSNAATIRAQSNDTFLLLLLYDFAEGITSDTVLFHDAFTTHRVVPEAVFRKVTAEDGVRIFAHELEPVGDWLLEAAGSVVATGGFLTHYNPPYADIFMEVARPVQRRGYGSYLVQELKRVCYAAGKKPAARCHASNTGSRKTLEKAGMLPCARILLGRVNRAKVSAL